VYGSSTAFFRRKHVQSMIEAMLSSGASGCALTLLDIQQQLVDRADWIFEDAGTIVSETFEEDLSNQDDLRDAAKTQVSVLCQSFKWFMLKDSNNIVR